MKFWIQIFTLRVKALRARDKTVASCTVFCSMQTYLGSFGSAKKVRLQKEMTMLKPAWPHPILKEKHVSESLPPPTGKLHTESERAQQLIVLSFKQVLIPNDKRKILTPCIRVCLELDICCLEFLHLDYNGPFGFYISLATVS